MKQNKKQIKVNGRTSTIEKTLHCKKSYKNKDKYVSLIRGFGIENNVHIVDRYISNEEVGLYFSASDIIIAPYISGTQSGVIQIAFGFDKPVIATNVGGFAEVDKDGSTGYVVNSKDSKALSKAVLKFYAKNKSAEFEKNVRKRKKLFSWDKIVKCIGEFK